MSVKKDLQQIAYLETYDLLKPTIPLFEVKVNSGNTKSKYRIIESGDVVEIYRYQTGIETGVKKGGRKKGQQSVMHEKHVREKVVSNRNYIRRLVNSNFDNTSKFVTLTFRDTSDFDIRDLRACNYEFKKFIQRLKYFLQHDFKYIAVVEFQDKYKRGAVHYHMVAALPYIEFDKLSEIWGLGFIGVNLINNCDNIGAYMTKYMSKKMTDTRLEGNKSYFTSRGLDKPTVKYFDALDSLGEKLKDKEKSDYHNDYYSKYHLKVDYWEYNLKRKNTDNK